MSKTNRIEMDQISRIEAAEVKRRMDHGDALVFVDARNPDAWSKATTEMPHAIRVPVDEVEEHVDEIPRDSAVITYCT